jgi:hypothetical protein
VSFSPRAIAALRGIRDRTPAEPVPEADLVALEIELGVTLPADHRAFLEQVADGLDVPGYPQIFSVARLRAHVARESMRPAAPFTYPPSTVAAMVAVLAEHPAHTSEARAGLTALAYHGALDGCVPIADGDGDTVVLVVTGPCRGMLFRNGDIDAPEHERLYTVTSGDATPLDFRRWLPLWLETMVARVELSG